MMLLCKNGKRKNFTVHRLVANAFIPNIENKQEINHKDGNKQNNRVDNLEWVTKKENIKHSYTQLKRIPFSPSKGKFGKESKSSKIIKQYTLEGKFIKKWDSKIEASKELKIDAGSMSKCCNKIRKSAGGFIWKYE